MIVKYTFYYGEGLGSVRRKAFRSEESARRTARAIAKEKGGRVLVEIEADHNAGVSVDTFFYETEAPQVQKSTGGVGLMIFVLVGFALAYFVLTGGENVG